MLPLLQARIETAKTKRLKAKHELRLKQRTALIAKLYDAHLKTLAPTTWPTLPRLCDVVKFPLFDELVKAEGDVAVTETLGELERELPKLMQACMEEREITLRTKVLTARNAITAVPATLEMEEGEIAESIITDGSGYSESHTTPDVLNLATSIFLCS